MQHHIIRIHLFHTSSLPVKRSLINETTPRAAMARTRISRIVSKPRKSTSTTLTILYPPANSFELAIKYRSEEHTSELQSRGHLVCRLLLEKKKIKKK